MKKMLLVLSLAVIVLLLAGCKGKIMYVNEYGRSENVEKLKEGYVLDRGHSFDIVDTEQGYDITLHFVKKGDD